MSATPCRSDMPVAPPFLAESCFGAIRRCLNRSMDEGVIISHNKKIGQLLAAMLLRSILLLATTAASAVGLRCNITQLGSPAGAGVDCVFPFRRVCND